MKQHTVESTRSHGSNTQREQQQLGICMLHVSFLIAVDPLSADKCPGPVTLYSPGGGVLRCEAAGADMVF